MLMDRVQPRVVPVDTDNPAIVKDHSLCSKCGHCYEVCENEIGVGAKFRFGVDEDYNQKDADGFINLFGLPIKVQALAEKNWNE